MTSHLPATGPNDAAGGALLHAALEAKKPDWALLESIIVKYGSSATCSKNRCGSTVGSHWGQCEAKAASVTYFPPSPAADAGRWRQGRQQAEQEAD